LRSGLVRSGDAIGPQVMTDSFTEYQRNLTINPKWVLQVGPGHGRDCHSDRK
jgi:hypothetical protein